MKTSVIRKNKPFSGIDKNPSLLGFGCMRFPLLNGKYDAIDEEKAEALIDLAYERGVNYFDTAYSYHGGESEKFIGRILKKYPRDSYFIANKMPSWLIESLDDVKRIFHEQLEKCHVDYFDYYLCHTLNAKLFEAYRIPGVMEFLYDMKRQGKIRHLGFSFHDTPDVLQGIVDAFEWDFVQLQINYLDWTRQDAKKQYDIAVKNRLPVIVMEPVRGGTLATLCEASRAVLQNANPHVSVASWAIRYVASLSNVMVILSGMSNRAQTEDNIKTLSEFTPVSKEEQAVIDEALSLFLEKNTIPCTMCEYCLPCPEAVAIPKMFDLYNEYVVSNFAAAFLNRYEKMSENDASRCIACGVCLDKCPQKIDIPSHMSDISRCIDALMKKE